MNPESTYKGGEIDSLAVRKMVYGSLMAALIAVGAFIAVPIGPVPIVLQNLFVMLAGLLLGGRWGCISVAIYLLAGALGLPVFAGGSGGIARLVGPTGGYLIGFAPAALVIGWLSGRGGGRFVGDVAAMVVGTIIIYVIGVTWLGVVADLSPKAALLVGMVPFLPGDAVKIIIAAIVARKLRSRIGLFPPDSDESGAATYRD
jgi:biotin transport system substrate-specific component